MLKLRAEDYGFEPNVKGFEESNNLAYMDGPREGYDDGYAVGYVDGYFEGVKKSKLENAKNFIKLGIRDKAIAEAFGLDLKIIQELKKIY